MTVDSLAGLGLDVVRAALDSERHKHSSESSSLRRSARGWKKRAAELEDRLRTMEHGMTRLRSERDKAEAATAHAEKELRQARSECSALRAFKERILASVGDGATQLTAESVLAKGARSPNATMVGRRRSAAKEKVRRWHTDDAVCAEQQLLARKVALMRDMSPARSTSDAPKDDSREQTFVSLHSAATSADAAKETLMSSRLSPVRPGPSGQAAWSQLGVDSPDQEGRALDSDSPRRPPLSSSDDTAAATAASSSARSSRSRSERNVSWASDNAERPSGAEVSLVSWAPSAELEKEHCSACRLDAQFKGHVLEHSCKQWQGQRVDAAAADADSTTSTSQQLSQSAVAAEVSNVGGASSGNPSINSLLAELERKAEALQEKSSGHRSSDNEYDPSPYIPRESILSALSGMSHRPFPILSRWCGCWQGVRGGDSAERGAAAATGRGARGDRLRPLR